MYIFEVEGGGPFILFWEKAPLFSGRSDSGVLRKWPLVKFSSFGLKSQRILLRMVDDEIKNKKNGRSAKPASWRGPKPVKSLQNLMEAQEACTRVLPK